MYLFKTQINSFKRKKEVTVRRVRGLAVIIELSSNTLQNFVDPFKILRKSM